MDEIKEEILKAKSINGSIDPKWDKKLDNFIERANKFISDINDHTKKKNYLKDSNAAKAYLITLSVDNDGNAMASDVRVEIPIPEWLLAFEKFPQKSDVPVPISPKIGDKTALFGNITSINMSNGFSHTLLGTRLNRTSACYLKETDIYF